MRIASQLQEAQNISSSPSIRPENNILGKREHEHEDSMIKAQIDLEIAEIEQSTCNHHRI